MTRHDFICWASPFRFRIIRHVWIECVTTVRRMEDKHHNQMFSSRRCVRAWQYSNGTHTKTAYTQLTGTRWIYVCISHGVVANELSHERERQYQPHTLVSVVGSTFYTHTHSYTSKYIWTRHGSFTLSFSVSYAQRCALCPI